MCFKKYALILLAITNKQYLKATNIYTSKMIQKEFANDAVEILKTDKDVIGLAVGGSWLPNELDEFSDLDLILVTKERISNNKDKMLQYAKSLGQLLTGFTGEHVGEPRLLICLYKNPLLHVDIKFLVLDEFKIRMEDPIILLDTDHQLQKIIHQTVSSFPNTDYQWMEDRFWIWIHYALLKIGRGELLEALDFIAFLRLQVLGPLLHLKNKNLPRGVRKIETQIDEEDFAALLYTIPTYNCSSILNSLEKAVLLYQQLRRNLFTSNINLHIDTEKKVIEYLEKIKQIKN